MTGWFAASLRRHSGTTSHSTNPFCHVACSEEGSASGAGPSAASWDLSDDCPLQNDPLGFAPPKFLMWALGVYMVATQLVFWLGYVFMGNAFGFSHEPPRLTQPGESPPIIRGAGLTSPHAAAMAHQNAQVSAATHLTSAAKPAEGTRRI